jgi:hypothetical protein
MHIHQVVKNGVVIAEVSLQNEPTIEEMVRIDKSYIPDPKPIAQVIKEKIASYQLVADRILLDLKTANTLSGITVSQSSQMFKDYRDVIIMIREGAFPSAIYEIGNLGPMGFASQELLDEWVAIIQKEL